MTLEDIGIYVRSKVGTAERMGRKGGLLNTRTVGQKNLVDNRGAVAGSEGLDAFRC